MTDDKKRRMASLLFIVAGALLLLCAVLYLIGARPMILAIPFLVIGAAGVIGGIAIRPRHR